MTEDHAAHGEPRSKEAIETCETLARQRAIKTAWERGELWSTDKPAPAEAQEEEAVPFMEKMAKRYGSGGTDNG